jgi:trans-2,3-dihydro-3-hydroxyanthranilate isomerase
VKIPFYFVDVFAEQPLTGNPLAVIPHADALDDLTMCQIAAEFNQAETTFIVPSARESADWRLRSFTASGHEVFGARAQFAWSMVVAGGVGDAEIERWP